MNFIQLAAKGEIRLDQIDDFVDIWHLQDVPSGELYEFLGMTEAEYVRWVKDPDTLAEIVASHKNDRVEINLQFFTNEAKYAAQAFFMPVVLPWILFRRGPDAARDHFLKVWRR